MKAYVLHHAKFAATLAAALLAGSAAAQSPQLMASATAPAAFAGTAQAQPLISFASDSSSAGDSSSANESSTVNDLPDAPVATTPRAFMVSVGAAPPSGTVAGKYVKYIPADETAQPITARDKVIIGLRDLYSAEDLLAWVASAGYEQATNGSPNYGTNSEAFAKRFGAAAARETSQGVFTDCVFSPIFRMDPRYYVQGSQYNFFHRVVYAATRVLVTKTDSGKATINAPLLVGYAASTALSNAYYPQINRNFRDGASEYGGSLGGAAIGFLVDEFIDDTLHALHLKK